MFSVCNYTNKPSILFQNKTLYLLEQTTLFIENAARISYFITIYLNRTMTSIFL